MCAVSIVESNGINPVFVKANSSLLEKYKEDFQKESTIEARFNLLTKYWQTEYKAQLRKKDNTLAYIEFKNSNDMTLFLLRWS
jgi:hypothetical protein